MPGKFVLPVFFAVILLGAVVLGPVIYYAAGVVWPIPFHRAMDRALLVSAVAALGLFGPRLELRALWPWNADAWKQLLLGVVIAAVSIQAIVGFELAGVGFTREPLTPVQAWGRVLLSLVAAVVAAPLEETVFRGFLQRELVRGLGWRAGWAIAAVIFMLAHFLKVPTDIDGQPVHPWSGVGALGLAFENFARGLADPENALKALNLTLAGLILGGIFLRAGTLWLNAGLHGGWIFGLLVFTGFARRDEPARVAFLGGDVLSSLVTTLVFSALGLWLWRYYRNPSIVPETGPEPS